MSKKTRVEAINDYMNGIFFRERTPLSDMYRAVREAFDAGADWGIRQKEKEMAQINVMRQQERQRHLDEEREREKTIAELREQITRQEVTVKNVCAERDAWHHNYDQIVSDVVHGRVPARETERLVPRGPFPPKPEVSGVSQTEIMAAVMGVAEQIELLGDGLNGYVAANNKILNEIYGQLDRIEGNTGEDVIMTHDVEVKEDASGLKAMWDAIPTSDNGELPANPVKHYGDYDASPKDAGSWSRAVPVPDYVIFGGTLLKRQD